MPENKTYDYVTKDITITYADGSKKRHKVRGKTKKELNKKIDELKIRAASGELRPTANIALESWAARWLEVYKKPKLSAGNYKKYMIVYQKYLPLIGSIPLSKLTQLDVQSFINQFEGKSKSYINFAVNFIKSCLKAAEYNNLITATKLIAANKPRGTYKGRRPLTSEERRAFVAVMDKHPKGLLFGMILACGFRPQEIRALKKEDINIKTGEIIINKAVKEDGTIGMTKSSSGNRITIMPSWYLAKFKAYYKTVMPNNYVFGGTSVITKQNMKRAWKSFLRLMDIEMGAVLYRNKIIESKLTDNITPYYLRHTFCTDLARAGVPLKTAQYLMGHSSPALTAQIYQHYQEDTKISAIKALDRFQISQIKNKNATKTATKK